MFDYEKINISMTKRELENLIKDEVITCLSTLHDNLLEGIKEKLQAVQPDFYDNETAKEVIKFLKYEEILFDFQIKTVTNAIEEALEDTVEYGEEIDPTDNIISILESEALKQ